MRSLALLIPGVPRAACPRCAGHKPDAAAVGVEASTEDNARFPPLFLFFTLAAVRGLRAWWSEGERNEDSDGADVA